jgi:hypothetical protein
LVSGHVGEAKAIHEQATKDKTSIQARKSAAPPQNIPEPAQSDANAAGSEAQDVHSVHTFLFEQFDVPRGEAHGFDGKNADAVQLSP